MDWTERRERLRSLIAGPRCIYPGSVFDAISARIAEDLGYEAGMFAGSIASFAVLGAPDVVVLTLTEFAQQAYRINRAGKLPLLCRSVFAMKCCGNSVGMAIASRWLAARYNRPNARYRRPRQSIQEESSCGRASGRAS